MIYPTCGVEDESIYIDANGTAFGLLAAKGDPGFTPIADEMGFYEGSTRRMVILAASLLVALSTGTLFSFPYVIISWRARFLDILLPFFSGRQSTLCVTELEMVDLEGCQVLFHDAILAASLLVAFSPGTLFSFPKMIRPHCFKHSDRIQQANL